MKFRTNFNIYFKYIIMHMMSTKEIFTTVLNKITASFDVFRLLSSRRNENQ